MAYEARTRPSSVHDALVKAGDEAPQKTKFWMCRAGMIPAHQINCLICLLFWFVEKQVEQFSPTKLHKILIILTKEHGVLDGETTH